MALLDVLRMPFVKLLAYSFCIFASICPGVILLYMHKPELFITLNSLILIMLAVAVTNPILLANILLIYQFVPLDIPNRFELGLVAASLCTYMFFGVILLLDFFYKFPLQLAIFLIIFVQALWTIIVIFFKDSIRDGFKKGYISTQQKLGKGNASG